MSDDQTISTEIWKVRLPADWNEGESSSKGSVYFESSDGTKGAYFSSWRLREDQRSEQEALESFRMVDLRNLDRMEGYIWERVNEWSADSPSKASAVDCLDREHSYRIVCLVIVRFPWLVRSSFHDYDCADYEASKAFFQPIIESLEIHEG